MNILVLSSDKLLLNAVSNLQLEEEIYIKLIANLEDEVGIVSRILANSENIIIVDDDDTSPNSLKYIQLINKSSNRKKIIFITSDNSVEFGRDIVALGVSFYVIKPIEDSELSEYIKSAIKQLQKVS